MHSSSDVKQGLAEFFIHLCHLAASAAVIKPHHACKEEKHIHLFYLGIDDFVEMVDSQKYCGEPCNARTNSPENFFLYLSF